MQANRDPAGIATLLQPAVKTKLPGLICVCIVLGMLAVGLGPFESPPNAVSWLRNRNGVQLGRHASILSDGLFGTRPQLDGTTRSLEIWLEPDLDQGSSTLLAFSTAQDPMRFSLRQFESGLVMMDPEHGRASRKSAGVGHVFRRGQPVFVTLTFGARESAVYIDGTRAETFPQFQYAPQGRLILGTAATGHSDWRGKILGFALYADELSTEQVRQHYHTWTQQGRPTVSVHDRPTALYLFNEQAGDTIHNSVGTGIDLKIPKRYTLLHQKFLEPFWAEYKFSGSYWIDILINVIGFVPLGVAFYSYQSFVRPIDRAALVTVALGLAVSFTIEVLQSYLPTRNSGTMDLFTNTLGTYLGVKYAETNSVKITANKLLRRLQFD